MAGLFLSPRRIPELGLCLAFPSLAPTCAGYWWSLFVLAVSVTHRAFADSLSSKFEPWVCCAGKRALGDYSFWVRKEPSFPPSRNFGHCAQSAAQVRSSHDLVSGTDEGVLKDASTESESKR